MEPAVFFSVKTEIQLPALAYPETGHTMVMMMIFYVGHPQTRATLLTGNNRA